MNYFNIKLQHIKIVILTLFLFACKNTTIENYKGKNINEVKPILEQKGLEVKVISQEVDQAENIILQQDLPANTQLKKGETINFVVSKRPIIQLSNYKNKNIDEIRPLLEQQGISLKIIEKEVDIPSGTILSDTPLSAAKYSTLTLEVSKQPTIQVPEVKNMSINNASDKLKKLGFSTKVVQDISALKINDQLHENTMLIDDVLNIYLVTRENKQILSWLKQCVDNQFPSSSNKNCLVVQQDALKTIKQNQQLLKSAIATLKVKSTFNQNLLNQEKFIYKQDQKVAKNSSVNIHVKKLPSNEQAYIEDTLKLINFLQQKFNNTLARFELLESLLGKHQDIFIQENKADSNETKAELILSDDYQDLYQSTKKELENLKKQSQEYSKTKSPIEESSSKESRKKQVARQEILDLLNNIDEDINKVSFNYNKSRFEYRDIDYNKLMISREKNKFHGKILMTILKIPESKSKSNSQQKSQSTDSFATSGNLKIDTKTR